MPNLQRGPRAPKSNDPSRSELLSTRALLLLVVAALVGWLTVANPPLGGAVIAALSVLALLHALIGS